MQPRCKCAANEIPKAIKKLTTAQYYHLAIFCQGCSTPVLTFIFQNFFATFYKGRLTLLAAALKNSPDKCA